MTILFILGMTGITIPLIFLSKNRIDQVFTKKTIKVFYQQGKHKDFIGKFICTFNDEFFEINGKYINWTEFSKADTDDAYVFLYLNGLDNVVIFPKFPKGLSFNEKDKLNEIIQSRLNVNIRL